MIEPSADAEVANHFQERRSFLKALTVSPLLLSALTHPPTKSFAQENANASKVGIPNAATRRRRIQEIDKKVDFTRIKSHIVASSARLLISNPLFIENDLGSGAFIETPEVCQNGMFPKDKVAFLTATHNLAKIGNGSKIFIQPLTSKKQYEAELIGRYAEVKGGPQKADLALLAVTISEAELVAGKIRLAPIASEGSSYWGDQVAAVGAIGPKRALFQETRVLQISPQAGDPPFGSMIIGCEGQEGQSGGGIFNVKGELVGIRSGADKSLPGIRPYYLPDEISGEVLFYHQPIQVDDSKGQIWMRDEQALESHLKAILPGWAHPSHFTTATPYQDFEAFFTQICSLHSKRLAEVQKCEQHYLEFNSHMQKDLQSNNSSERQEWWEGTQRMLQFTISEKRARLLGIEL